VPVKRQKMTKYRAGAVISLPAEEATTVIKRGGAKITDRSFG
jgi:hypothetical protein